MWLVTVLTAPGILGEDEPKILYALAGITVTTDTFCAHAFVSFSVSSLVVSFSETHAALNVRVPDYTVRFSSLASSRLMLG